MDEQKKEENQRTEKETANTNFDDGQHKTSIMIEEAFSAAKELRRENDRLQENIARMERLGTYAILGGRAEAGINQLEKTPEQIKKEKAAEFFKGTSIAEAIKKHG
jgi:hypothetical protein